MATIPIVQLFRNSKIISGRSAAIDTLKRQKEYVPDGGLILATYSSDNGVKTLLGIVRNSGSGNADLTIIDVEGAAENLQSAITSAINSLNKVDAEEEGQYVASVSEENGIIKVTRTPLPSVEKNVRVGEAVTAVTQTNGKIGVEYGRINALNVSVTDSIDRFQTDNVEGVLNELYTGLNEVMSGVGMMIDGKINALNSNPSFKSQHITVGVDQYFGKIISVFVQEQNIASASLLGTTSDTKDNETAFGYIAKEVAAREDAIDALSTSSTVTLESAAGTESGVLNVYTIKQGDREVGTINIPKDLVVTSGSVVKGTWDGNTFTEDVSGSGTSTGTALKLVIANQTNPVYINTLDLVKDHTAGNGISISDTNEISVKKDSTSEPFLTVGENGVKLSGVQAAIDAAAASATTKVEKTGEGSHITVTSSKSNSDSSVTYTISESDIASEAALTAEVSARQSADTTLQNNIDNVNSTIESYGQVTSQALNDLGTRLDDYGKVTSQSLNDLSTKFGDYYTKTEVDTAISNVDVTGQLQNYYTKTEVDSKDSTIQTALDALSGDTKTKIDAEVAARVSGDNALQTALDALDAHVNENEDIVSKSLNDLNNRIGNTYVKSYIDALEARIAELETKFLNMENNGLQAGEY